MRWTSLFLIAVLFPCCLVFGEEQPSTDDTATKPEPAETLQDPAIPQRYLAKISPYKPMYFSIGWNETTNARFQFSFKYRFVNPEGALANRSKLFNHLHFGYTQTSLWDLESDSAPFYDTSYRPVLFIYRPLVHRPSSGRWTLGLEAGVEHESNGQSGNESRSLNIAYAQPIFNLGEVWGSRLTVAPKFYAYISGLTDNNDLAAYRGYVDLEVALTDREGWKFAATLRKGTTRGYGSMRADISFPLDKIFHRTFDAFVHVQYFNGWGESLRSYDQKLSHQIRLGLMIVR